MLPEAKLKVAGWLSEKDRDFYDAQIRKIHEADLADRFEHVEAPDSAAKLKFFSEVDLFSVPTRFAEPKGLYVLEAMACGLPVVAPDHGPFPEMIESSRGGTLFGPGLVESLVAELIAMLEDLPRRNEAGCAGRKWVEERGSRRKMAEATAGVFTTLFDEIQQD